jgi:hypothetical protein
LTTCWIGPNLHELTCQIHDPDYETMIALNKANENKL